VDRVPDRDLRVLAILAEWFDDVGHAPSLRELAVAAGLGSANGAMHAVRRLERSGLVGRVPRQPRALVLTAEGSARLERLRATTVEPRRIAVEIAVRFEHAHLRALGALAGRAPTLSSTERMLRLLAERARQLGALESAAQRCARRGEELTRGEAALARSVERRSRSSVRRLRSWDDYVVHEGVVAEHAMVVLPGASAGGPDPAQVGLGASSAMARRCLTFALDEVPAVRRVRSTAEVGVMHARELEELDAMTGMLGEIAGGTTAVASAGAFSQALFESDAR
jgi:hypothetical protein